MSKYTKTFSNGQPLDAADLNALVSANNDTYDFARGGIGTAQRSAEDAQRAAQQVEQFMRDLQTLMQSLPNGQAYAAQVAANAAKLLQHDNALNEQQQAIEDIEDELDYKANADGYYQSMRTGFSDALADTGENVEYREFIGGRMVNNAPEQQGSRVPNSTSAVTDIYLKEVSGVSGGGNQMVENTAFINSSTKDSAPVFNALYRVNDASGAYIAGKDISKPTDLTLTNFVFSGIVDVPSNGASILYKHNGYSRDINLKNINVKPSCKYLALSYLKSCDVTKLEGLDGDFYLTNLTTLPQLPTTFVASLGENDASKVLHRLGFYSYTINSQSLAVTHNNEDTLQLGAEVIAKMGYQEPKMTLSNVGRINLISGKTGAKKYSVDMRLHLRKAWEKVLERIEEQGIAIPEILKEPRLCKVSDNVGIILRPDGIEVSAWVVDLGSLSWTSRDYEDKKLHYSLFNNLKEPVKDKAYLCCVRYEAKPYIERKEGSIFAVKNFFLSQTGLYVYDSSIADASAFKTAMQGQYLIYQLAEPLFIPFEELSLGKLALSFVDVMPYDIWTLDDMDGNPMYKVESTENASHVITSRIYPNPDWVEANKQLPVAIDTVLSGFKTSANYALIMDMLRRINNAGL